MNAQQENPQKFKDQVLDAAIDSVRTFSDYAQLAQRTAVFPDGQALGYLGLGVADEVGELNEKVYALQNRSEITLDGLVGEVGDVYWYIANLAARLGLTEELRLSASNGEYEGYRPSFHDAVWAHDRVQESVMVDAAHLAGLLKKTIRGDEADKRPEIKSTLLSMLDDLDMILSALQLPSPVEVAKANLRKLFDRKDRGVLKGDGDQR